MRRLVWAFLIVAGAAGAEAQTTVSGPVTFGTGLSVSGSGTVSVATGGISNAMLANPGLTLGSTGLTLGAATTAVSGLTLSGATVSGTTSLPGGGVITSTGLVAIGTSSPLAPLVVDSSLNPLGAGFGSLVIQGNANKERVDIYSAGAVPGPAFQGKGFGGTVASPTATTAGMDLFILGASGYNGSAFAVPNPATIHMRADDDWSATDTGTNISFYTTPDGSTAAAQRLFIANNGAIGIGTSSPAATLDVQTTWSGSSPGNLSGSWTSYGDTSRFVIRGANGTQAAPGAILAGQTVGNINFRGYTSGGAWTNGVVNIQPVAEEDYGATSDATGLSFGTTPSGSTAWQSHMYLSGAGSLGIGTAAPGYLLDVQGGQVNASGGFVAAGAAGVSCSGAPTAAFAVTAGIVTHC